MRLPSCCFSFSKWPHSDCRAASCSCFSSFSYRTMAWSFALLAVRLDTSCFSSSNFRMSPVTSPFSWALHSSSLASWSSSREIFPWRISITSSKHSFS